MPDTPPPRAALEEQALSTSCPAPVPPVFTQMPYPYARGWLWGRTSGSLGAGGKGTVLSGQTPPLLPFSFYRCWFGAFSTYQYIPVRRWGTTMGPWDPGGGIGRLVGATTDPPLSPSLQVTESKPTLPPVTKCWNLYSSQFDIPWQGNLCIPSE